MLLVRMQPLLREAAESPVYQAYLSREAALRSRGWFGRKVRGKSMSLNDLVYIGLIVVLIFIPFGICALPFFVLGFSIYRFVVIPRRRRTEHVVPRTISECFGQEETYVAPAMDFWQAGVTGRDVIHAIYTERWLARFRGTLATVFVLWALIAGIPVAIVRPFNFVSIICIIQSGLICISVGFVTILTGGEDCLNNVIRPTLRMWSRDRQTEKLAVERIVQFVIALPTVVVILVFCILIGYITARLVPDPRVAKTAADIGFFTMTEGRRILLIMLAATLPVVPASLAFGYLVHRRHPKKLAESIGEADGAFDRYMREAIMEDPDWARRE